MPVFEFMAAVRASLCALPVIECYAINLFLFLYVAAQDPSTAQRRFYDFTSILCFFSLLSDVDGVVVAAAIPLLYRSLISCCMLLLLRRKSIEICSQRMGRQRVFFFYAAHCRLFYSPLFTIPLDVYVSLKRNAQPLTHTYAFASTHQHRILQIIWIFLAVYDRNPLHNFHFFFIFFLFSCIYLHLFICFSLCTGLELCCV